jgi:Protein of unknown function (DUF3035)
MMKFTSRHVFTATALLAAAVVMSGCQSTKRSLGIDKSVPDEFAIAAPAPLVIPPDFNLRPPAPGSDRQPQLSASQAARTALVGRARLQDYLNRGLTPGEASLLAHAGADTVPPAIRETLDKEVSSFAAEEKTFTDRLVFWRQEGPGGTAIDPVAEMKRLSQNAAAGKKASEGPIPVITKGRSAILGIF